MTSVEELLKKYTAHGYGLDDGDTISSDLHDDDSFNGEVNKRVVLPTARTQAITRAESNVEQERTVKPKTSSLVTAYDANDTDDNVDDSDDPHQSSLVETYEDKKKEKKSKKKLTAAESKTREKKFNSAIIHGSYDNNASGSDTSSISSNEDTVGVYTGRYEEDEEEPDVYTDDSALVFTMADEEDDSMPLYETHL
jgi:hypothetical protein